MLIHSIKVGIALYPQLKGSNIQELQMYSIEKETPWEISSGWNYGGNANLVYYWVM